MKNSKHKLAAELVTNDLIRWLIHLKRVETQLNQRKPLSYDNTSKLSHIINNLDQVRKDMERTNFYNSHSLISCFSYCVLKLKDVYKRLLKESHSEVLEMMVGDKLHFYKVQNITDADFCMN